MAKLIILDGLSRTGKTTITNRLRDDGYGKIISLDEKRPVNTDVTSFYKGIGMISKEFYKAFHNEIFILDRSFMSEIVFSKFFKRTCSMSINNTQDLLEENDVIQFYLWNDHEDYIKRNPKDRYTYSKDDYDVLKSLFATECINWSCTEDNDENVIDLCRTTAIDTSRNNIDQVYEIIINQIAEHNLNKSRQKINS